MTASVVNMDAVADVRAARRAAARATLGVSGIAGDAPPLRPVLRKYGLTLYPAAALGVLNVVDSFQAYAFTVLTPEISRALGMSFGAIALARTVQFLAVVLAPLPMAALSQARGRRALLCIVTGLTWSVVTLYTGFVTSLIALILVLLIDGLSTGSVYALHPPLLVDSYPPEARVRVITLYHACNTIGSVVSPLLVGLIAGPAGFTWRGVFLMLGAISTVSALGSLGLRDPGPGRFDTEQLRAQGHSTPDSGVELGFFEIVRRLLLIPTVKRLSTGYFVLGVFLIPFATFLSTYLDQRWHMGPAARGAFFAGSSVASIVALAIFGKRAENAFREDPAKVLGFAGVALGCGVTLIALGALSPIFAVMCVLFAAGQAMVTLLSPSMTASLMSIMDARYRPHAAAVVGIFTACGSVVGTLFLTGLDRRFGVGGSIIALLIPGIIGALVIRSAGGLIDRDLDRMIDEVLEGEDQEAATAAGETAPMLACRGVDFSYGQLQVLFDVDFKVDAGEMVALLGTNGAGKSTLLKVVSGIGLPSSGSVRYDGRDITYLDAERRLRLGITQVPGGRAVFGPLDVVENMRLFGYALGRDRKVIDEAIERCFEAFPRLRERRHSLAATLSGGEQQMLGLSKALILRPRLLLIDELSLGLAPVIVAQLLEMVRRINEEGTGVVLVEQSVNIALSLVDHAYFMEKGQMRFDGPARQLLERDDLLRAVFLEGAAKGAGA